MIAAAIATTITTSIASVPCEASTAHAISAVSPGTGSPNDSSVSSTKRSTSAHDSWLSTNVSTDATGSPTAASSPLRGR